MLRKWREGEDFIPVDPLQGSILESVVPKKRSGAQSSDRAAVNCALDFAQICELCEVTYQDLDAWFKGWACWALNVHFLFDDNEAAVKFQEHRESTQGIHLPLRNMSPSSFRTYANAVCRKFNEVEPADGVYLLASSVKQFKALNEVMKKTLMKEGKEKALRSGPDFENDVLVAAELELLYSQTNFACAYQAQRYNMIIMGFRTGFRPEMLVRLHVGSLVESKDSDGRRVLTVCLESMKNLVQDMSKADIALFKCPIIEGPDARYCAVRAIDRQLQLLATADNVVDPSPISFFFRRSRLCSPILGVEGTTPAVHDPSGYL
jgi:hypothetical protein